MLKGGKLDRIFIRIASLPHLQHFSCRSFGPGSTEESLSIISLSSSIEELVLGDITEFETRCLGGMRKLRLLDIEDANQDVLQALVNCRNLKSLFIRSPRKFGQSLSTSNRSVLRRFPDSFTTFGSGDVADLDRSVFRAIVKLRGLSHLEVAAENLRKIEKNLASLGKLDAKKQDLIEINLKRNKEYGTKKWEDIKTTLLQMIAKYCSESASTKSLTLIINETAKAIKTRIDKLSEEEKRHTTLLEISRLDIASQIKEVRANAVKLSSSSEPLIVEKLTVLKAAVTYSNKNVENEIDCPACGRSIESSEFAGHVKAEEKALKEAVADFDTYKANINVLCESLYSLKKFLKQNSIEDWKTSLDYQAVNYIERLDIEGLRSSCKEEELSKIEENVGIVITAASSEVKDPLPDAASLVADKEKLEVIKEIVRGSGVKGTPFFRHLF
jgi:hypothetical protein